MWLAFLEASRTTVTIYKREWNVCKECVRKTLLIKDFHSKSLQDSTHHLRSLPTRPPPSGIKFSQIFKMFFFFCFFFYKIILLLCSLCSTGDCPGDAKPSNSGACTVCVGNHNRRDGKCCTFHWRNSRSRTGSSGCGTRYTCFAGNRACCCSSLGPAPGLRLEPGRRGWAQRARRRKEW